MLIAQELTETEQAIIDNDWYLQKLIIDDVTKPFVSDDEEPTPYIKFHPSSDGEAYGSLETSFCYWEAGEYQFKENQKILAYGWGYLALNSNYTNCNHDGTVPENHASAYDYYVNVLYNGNEDMTTEDQFYYDYEIIQEGNGKELIITNEIGNQAYFQNTPLSVSENKLAHVSIYPNPVKNFLNIGSLSTETDIEIFDLNGKLLFTKNLTRENAQLDFSFLADGMYIYRLKDKHHNIKSGKLIKK